MLPKYEKGESSHTNQKNHDAKINYTYTNADHVINMLESIEHKCMMDPKFDKDPNYGIDDEKPKLVLRTCNSQKKI